MITPDYLRLMASYAHWQNENLIAAADTLDEAARQADRGAFFKSISATFNHILWADKGWMHRLAGTPAPITGSIRESVAEEGDWQTFRKARAVFDQVMIDWAAGLKADDLAGDLTWFSGAMGHDVTKPRSVLMVHMFNHGTHHRGQIHTMLTAAGARPGDTDIPFMPQT